MKRLAHFSVALFMSDLFCRTCTMLSQPALTGKAQHCLQQPVPAHIRRYPCIWKATDGRDSIRSRAMSIVH